MKLNLYPEEDLRHKNDFLKVFRITLNFKVYQDAHFQSSFYFKFFETDGWKRIRF